MNVQDAAIAAIRAGKHGYTPSAGIDELRAAAARDIGHRRGLEISPEDVVVGAGAKPFIAYTIASVTDYGAGDEVIYPVPGFPIYESQILANGAVAVPIHLREARDFAFDPHELDTKITPKTRLLILNSPANPTGGVTPKREVDKLVAGLERHPDVAVLSDEIYDQMLYDGERHVCLLGYPSMRDRLILLNGWSKTYAMTGWRMGYAVWPKGLYEYARKLAVNCHSCVNTAAQWAGLAALTGPQDSIAKMVAEFDRRRKIVVSGLNKLPGISCATPKGAFYAFPNMARTGWKSKALASSLLEDAGVAVVGGPDFGVLGEGFLRLSYANSAENIVKALDRMGEFLTSRKAA